MNLSKKIFEGICWGVIALVILCFIILSFVPPDMLSLQNPIAKIVGGVAIIGFAYLLSGRLTGEW
jgi:uncharacterized membrane-anchored protein